MVKMSCRVKNNGYQHYSYYLFPGRSPRGGSRKGPGGSRGKQDSMESTETMDTKESMEDADSEGIIES